LQFANRNEDFSVPESDSFKQFVQKSKLFSERTKTAILSSVNDRLVSTWDAAFVYLEQHYPFRPTTTNIVKPAQVQPPSFDLDHFMGHLEFYVSYNPKRDSDSDFLEAMPEMIASQFGSDLSQITLAQLGGWFQETAPHFPFFRDHELSLRSALESLRYPTDVQDTGDLIYVGKTPRTNPTHFWEMLSILQNDLGIGSRNIHVVSLEADPGVEFSTKQAHYMRLYPDISEDDLADCLFNSVIENPYYWPIESTKLAQRHLGIQEYVCTARELPEVKGIVTHVSCWPDGDVPEKRYDPGIVHIVIKLAERANAGNGLTYIHCRAGLGRTGVLRIAIQYALNHLRKSPRISPVILLEAYRTNFRYAVQTPNQLAYLENLCVNIDDYFENH
jgi:hypothetical protein